MAKSQKLIIILLIILPFFCLNMNYNKAIMISNLLFFPESRYDQTPEKLGLSFEEVQISVEKDISLFGWHIKGNPGNITLLLLHGNAGNIAGRLTKAKDWVDQGVSVFLLDYRGFGKSTGKIKHEEDLVTDAKAALKWLNENNISNDQILIYGESIGSYPAIRLNKENKVKGLVLEGAFSEVKDLAKLHYGSIPEFVYQDFLMKNIEHIKEIHSSAYFIHGENDETCPKWMAEKLHELAPNQKDFHIIPEGEHNSTYEGYPEGLLKKIISFF